MAKNTLPALLQAETTEEQAKAWRSKTMTCICVDVEAAISETVFKNTAAVLELLLGLVGVIVISFLVLDSCEVVVVHAVGSEAVGFVEDEEVEDEEVEAGEEAA